MMACSVMQPLLLHKPSQQSRVWDHSHHLSRRIDLWKKGLFDELMNECCCIQNHLKSTHPGSDQSQNVAYLFDHPLSEGKVSDALHLLTVTHNEGVLPLDSLVPSDFNFLGSPQFKTTKKILQEKQKTSPGKCCYSRFSSWSKFGDSLFWSYSFKIIGCLFN